MGRTLLVGRAGYSWREWLRRDDVPRTVLCVDPDEPAFGFVGRATLWEGDRLIASRLLGTTEPARCPHLILAALAEWTADLPADAAVLAFKYRPAPALRTVLLTIIQLVRPDRILVPQGTPAQCLGSNVHETQALEWPSALQSAQRKAQWLKLGETLEEHRVHWPDVVTDGVRLGTGRVLEAEAVPGALHIEACGRLLHVVAELEPDERALLRTVDENDCRRTQVASPDAYRHLFCAFVREGGEEFGYGFVREVDWAARELRVACSAVPPAPVHTLRFGTIRVDERGQERPESRPGGT